MGRANDLACAGRPPMARIACHSSKLRYIARITRATHRCVHSCRGQRPGMLRLRTASRHHLL
eukprot:15246849-Alexandrium_andersonii.AAC.1